MEAASESHVDEAMMLARRTAETAVPFANHIATRCSAIASGLRRGDDQAALAGLADASDDLEHFLKFLVLICDYTDAMDASASTEVRTYREQLMEIVESLQPSLGHIDLVEVADALEDDLVPALRDYRRVDDLVQVALRPA
jgi:hypothetical protein